MLLLHRAQFPSTTSSTHFFRGAGMVGVLERLGVQRTTAAFSDAARAQLRTCAVGPGRALIGDAAMHQDPRSGLGIDMARVHATFLADAIVDWLRGSADERTAFARYHHRRNAHGLGPYHETVRFAADLSKLEG